MDTKAGFIAIVGRPNVGKSTLLNTLLGQKVSITSRKPQTTRHRIMGILTEGPNQAVFIDTPGLHVEEKRAINRLMNRAASSSLSEVEMVIFVVDGLSWGKDDEMVLAKLARMPESTQIVLAINKEDKLKEKAALLPHIAKLQEQGRFDQVIPISAKTGKGLDQLKQMVLGALQESIHYFPEEYVTDRSQRFMAAEIIREKLMRFTGDEIPYSVTVEIESFTVNERGIFEIHGLILVDRQTQKRMVIGNKGEKLKTIGREARIDMENNFDNKVFLQLWVKVKSGWADDERALRSLGYGEE